MLEGAHKIIATTARELRTRLRGSRPRLKKSLDDLDREICKARLPDAAGSSEELLDVDALASAEEFRLFIGLHLDGWTWQEINTRLRNR